MLFGIGDGGGGPGESHLEALARKRPVRTIPVSRGRGGIFHRLETGKERYKTFRGELYLEKHQGTYTTRAEQAIQSADGKSAPGGRVCGHSVRDGVSPRN